MNTLDLFTTPDTTRTFDFEYHPITAMLIDGDVCFIASEVCKALDINNSRQALTYLDDDEKGVISSDTPGGTQTKAYITEAGLYSLVLRSRKPEAKRFKRWVTHEVLPTIRQTGQYAPPALTGPALMAAALIEAAKTIETTQAALAATTAELATVKPKAEGFDTFIASKGDYSMMEAAHLLNSDPRLHAAGEIGRNRLFTILQGFGWLYRDSTGHWAPRQTQIANGRLSVRTSVRQDTENGGWKANPITVKVTAKGIEAIRRHLLEDLATR